MPTYLVFEPESPEEPPLIFEPEPGCYSVGRDPQCDIHLADERVSRKHALFFIDDARVLVQDQNSRTGVFVDGTRISPRTSVEVESNNNIAIADYLAYIIHDLEEGVTAQPLAMKTYASRSPQELHALMRKVVDVRGKTIVTRAEAPSADDLPAPSGSIDTADAFVDDLPAETLVLKREEAPQSVDGSAEGPAGAAADSPTEEVRYTFPSMPAIPADHQDTVDRFIYRRIKPLFDQLVKERTGGSESAENVRDMAEDVLTDVLAQQRQHIPAGLASEDMVKLCLAAFLDYGPIQGLLGDETVTEIMINGANNIFIEQNGNLFKSRLRFWNDQELRRVIEKMVMVTNRRIDEQQPYQDTRLEDGSRVNVIIRPLALQGDSVTIRKFPNRRLMVQDLLNYDSLSPAMAQFLQLVVHYRANVIVSGGTGSGKTTLLNILSNFIPDTERVVSIEDAAELRLVQSNKVPLEARPKSLEGGGAVTIRDLVINALRMRPDRIVVGECRGGEAIDMLQAMNTGHDGSLTTLHANTPRDAIGRLETMCLMAGMDLPARAIRSQIVSAVNFIVQQSRIAGGARKIISIQEVLGLEGEQVVMQEVFRFTRTGINDEGKAQGYFEPTGVIPQFVSQLRDDKVDFPIDMFNAG